MSTKLNKFQVRWLTPRHIIIVFSKDKSKRESWKQREKSEPSHTRERQKIIADSLSEYLEARRQWANVVKVLKQKVL